MVEIRNCLLCVSHCWLLLESHREGLRKEQTKLHHMTLICCYFAFNRRTNLLEIMAWEVVLHQCLKWNIRLRDNVLMMTVHLIRRYCSTHCYHECNNHCRRWQLMWGTSVRHVVIVRLCWNTCRETLTTFLVWSVTIPSKRCTASIVLRLPRVFQQTSDVCVLLWCSAHCVYDVFQWLLPVSDE